MQNESEKGSNDSLNDQEGTFVSEQLEEGNPRATRKREKSRPAGPAQRRKRSESIDDSESDHIAFLALMIQKMRKTLGNPLI